MRSGLACLILFVLTGCGLELLTTTAIQSDLQARNAASAAQALDYAKQTTGQMGVQQAIDAYRAEKGQNPPSLEALVPEFLPSVPTGADGNPLAYDATTGRLTGGTVQVAPSMFGGGDTTKLQQVGAAVQKFGRETGRYPITLWTLVPNYLPEYPKTSSGQDFVYDPQTGAVYLPQSAAPQTMAQPAPGGAGRAGVGGGPLVGEAMTGIAISNQLDSMSNAGSSAAQGRAGSSLGRSQDLHNAQQEQALRDAGM